MSDERRVARVRFRKQVSDGNFGTEAAEVELEQDFDPASENEEVVASSLLMEARRLVHNELLRSPSARVRMALATPDDAGRPRTATGGRIIDVQYAGQDR